MDLIVSALQDHLGRAEYRGRSYRCAVGRTGISTAKTEGDGASPAGRFRLTRAFYRPDRVSPPDSRLETAALTETDGWCDDPAHPDYNRRVRLPHPARHERMWRDDGLYDAVAVTDQLL